MEKTWTSSKVGECSKCDRTVFILNLRVASILFLCLKLKDSFNQHVFSNKGFQRKIIYAHDMGEGEGMRQHEEEMEIFQSREDT